jgi:hypothetical protein
MKLTNTVIKLSASLIITTSTLNAQETIQERQERAQQVEQFYNMAVQAYEDGDITAAREALNSALTLNRSHAHSIALARQMKAQGNQTVLDRRKRLFNSVMIPIIDLSDVTFKDAINVLAKSVETQSKGQITPNFIIQDRGNTLNDVKITLVLKNVPAENVLDHLLKSAGASVTFGEYTTVIRPRGNASEQKQAKREIKEEEE